MTASEPDPVEVEKEEGPSTKYLVLAKRGENGWFEIGEAHGTKTKVIESVVDNYKAKGGEGETSITIAELRGCEFRAIATSSWGTGYETYMGVRPKK